MHDDSPNLQLGFSDFLGERDLTNYLANDGSLVLKTKITVISEVKMDVEIEEQSVIEVPRKNGRKC